LPTLGDFEAAGGCATAVVGEADDEDCGAPPETGCSTTALITVLLFMVRAA
jgi:hypothetical protein